MACLGSTTWAWFTTELPSTENKIKTAESCFITVTAERGGETVLTIDGCGSRSMALAAGEVYTVTISIPGGSSSGYCMIAADGKKYYSDYIVGHDEPTPKTHVFYLSSAEARVVTLDARWGIYSATCSVNENSEIVIS